MVLPISVCGIFEAYDTVAADRILGTLMLVIVQACK